MFRIAEIRDMLLHLHNPYGTAASFSSTLIQRSRLHPYLWIRLRRDGASYVLHRDAASICVITWHYCFWSKGARSRLRDGLAARKMSQDRVEEEPEEE